MLWKAKHADLPFWNVFLVITIILYNSIASATPFIDATPPSTLGNRELKDVEPDTLFNWLVLQGLRLDLIRDDWAGVDNEPTSFWDYHNPNVIPYGLSASAPYRNKQYGSVCLKREIGDQSQFGTYDAALDQKSVLFINTQQNYDESCADAEGEFVAKLSTGYGGYNGAMLMVYINDDHIPKVRLSSKAATGKQSLVVMEKLDTDAATMWKEYSVYLFDRLQMMEQITEGILKAHKKNIVHFNITLANIMWKPLSKQGDVGIWKIDNWNSAIPIQLYKNLAGYKSSEGFDGDQLKGKDVVSLAECLLKVTRKGDDLYQEALSRLRQRPTWWKWLKWWNPYISRRQTLKILKQVYQPDEAESAFWNFLAKALCGPKDRMSLVEFYDGLTKLRIPEVE